jgi:hypothetical protein
VWAAWFGDFNSCGKVLTPTGVGVPRHLFDFDEIINFDAKRKYGTT